MKNNLPGQLPGTITEQRAVHVPFYKVLLHNDDQNSMEHVIKALLRIFRFDVQACERIMMEAHTNGIALCAIESLERAELHRDQLKSCSLISTIEPE